jgi:hypothetical protein
VEAKGGREGGDRGKGGARGKRGEMTQTLYAHLNNRNFKRIKNWKERPYLLIREFRYQGTSNRDVQVYTWNKVTVTLGLNVY